MAVCRALTLEEKETLKSVIESEAEDDLCVDAVEAFEGCMVGENYTTVVTKIVATVHNRSTDKKFHQELMMKRLPDNEGHREQFRCVPYFLNEVALYTKVLPSMQTFCETSFRLQFPAYLKASEDIIILRHMAQDGYIMADRKEGLDRNHCLIVMKALGRFHAVSLAMKHVQPTVFEEVRSYVTEVQQVHGHIFQTSAELVLKIALLCLTQDKVEFDNSIKKLKNLQGKTVCTFRSLATPKEPLALICHGDLWTNNILFKYSGGSGKKVEDICFLDLQCSRYSSPATDILTFLYSSPQAGVTKQDFDELIHNYHSSLVESIQLLAPSAPSVSIEDILKEIKDHSVYGLLMSFLMLPAVTAEKELFEKVDISKLSSEMLEDQGFIDEILPILFHTQLRERIRETVAEFQSRGFF